MIQIFSKITKQTLPNPWLLEYNLELQLVGLSGEAIIKQMLKELSSGDEGWENAQYRNFPATVRSLDAANTEKTKLEELHRCFITLPFKVTITNISALEAKIESLAEQAITATASSSSSSDRILMKKREGEYQFVLPSDKLEELAISQLISIMCRDIGLDGEGTKAVIYELGHEIHHSDKPAALREFQKLSGKAITYTDSGEKKIYSFPRLTLELPSFILQPKSGALQKIDPNQPITPKITLDNLFRLFNENRQTFINTAIDRLDEITTEEQRDAVAKLHAALSHFADKNQNKQLSEDQMEMLKNNNTFMRFIGWIASLLPEFLQVGPIANCTNRYHVSKFEREHLNEVTIKVAVERSAT